MLVVPSMAPCSAALTLVSPATDQGQKNLKCDEKSVSALFFRAQQGPYIIHQKLRAALQSRQWNPCRKGDSFLRREQEIRPASKCTAEQQQKVTVMTLDHSALSKSPSVAGQNL